MERSFNLVNAKVSQADFFLGRLARSQKSAFEFHCYLSAFVTACRSVTYVLQAVMAKRPGFAVWYAGQQKGLQSSPCARFFHSVRRLDIHVGTIVLGPGRIEDAQHLPDDVAYSFVYPEDESIPSAPESDVLTACHAYYDEVALVVLECCIEFRVPIDPKVHFTQLNYESMGASLGDAMKEVLGTPDAILPELHGLQNQWMLLRELVWSSDLRSHFDCLHPEDSKSRKSSGSRCTSTVSRGETTQL